MKVIDADKLKKHIDKLPALPDGNFAGTHRNLKALINMQPKVKLTNSEWIDFLCEQFGGKPYISERNAPCNDVS